MSERTTTTLSTQRGTQATKLAKAATPRAKPKAARRKTFLAKNLEPAMRA